MVRFIFIFSLLAAGCIQAVAQSSKAPSAVVPVVESLKQSRWLELQDGLSLLSTITPDGLVLRAYRISPERFEFSVEAQISPSGSHAREIGEGMGAIIVANAGFFAINSSGELYPVGYLRINGNVISKGWREAGGTITFSENGSPKFLFHLYLRLRTIKIIHSISLRLRF